MSLTLSLNNALSGLNVNQGSLATLSQNIANANNPEYSRKIINQEAVYLEGVGSGARIKDVSRKIDDYLVRSVRSQGAVYSRSEALSNYTDRLQVLLGKPGSKNSVYSYVDGFFNSLQSLSQSPENVSLRVNAVNVANIASREVQNLATGVYDLQYEADQDIGRSLSTVNQNLKEIYVLNGTISTNKLLRVSTSELEDRRDSLIAEISSVLGVQTYEQSNGIVNIFVGGGVNLLDESVYELSYNGAPSADFFANNNATAPIQVFRLDEKGSRLPNPVELVSAGRGISVTTGLAQGSLKGMLDMRDRQLPDVSAKLDSLAGNIRDEFNRIHNSGVNFPGANSYTGTRFLAAEDFSQWGGKVRIAVLDATGKPIPSNYDNETTGARPLLIDLGKLDTGNGAGQPSVQGIIDEINRTYGVPQNKVEVGNVNNVQLVLNNTAIPGLTPQLNFDFQLENISGRSADFFVTGLQVLDSNDTDITSITQNVPKLNLAATNTYQTSNTRNAVTVTTASAHGYNEGDRVYLTPPATDVGGIPAAQLGGFFTIANVTANGFDISSAIPATSSGSFNRTNVTAQNAYASVPSGETIRTTQQGTIIANIAANQTSPFYTVKANVAVADANGVVSTSTITYRIDNLQNNVKNYRYAGASATGAGKLVVPNDIKPTVKAMLVDANGVELPVINNKYTTTQKGFLKIMAGDASHVVAIDSLDSAEQGKPNTSPATAGTGRGFSHYFELNNFFVQNRTDGVVDDIKGSASRLAVSDVIQKTPSLISLGKLVRSPNSDDVTQPPRYTYERNVGDNSIIDALAKLSQSTISFAAAGDLGATQQTFLSYSAQMLGTVSSKAATNKSDMDNAKLLLDGFKERSDAVRGVNLDEELANTIIYQNAYSASARIITTAGEMFDSLLQSV